MSKRHYSSFDEVDRDLKLLKLQKDIDKERVIFNFHQTKENLKPKSIAKSLIVSFFKTKLVYKGSNKILGFISRRF